MKRQNEELQKTQKMTRKLRYICRQFRIPGEVTEWRRIPSGHINEAYWVAVDDGMEVKEYLVQRVNTYVFRDPVAVMRNINLITRHLMDKAPATERRRRLHYHHTADGCNYIILEKNADTDSDSAEPVRIAPDETGSSGTVPGSTEFWRLCNYIESSVSFETAAGNAEMLRMAGKAFGRFDRQLTDLDPGQLVETIPHFHDTAYRLRTLFDIVDRDELDRVENALSEIAEIRDNAAYGCSLCRRIASGELPLRVTHNDTKTNNVLFDRDTLEPLVVIDLDTCMPGLACYDFGDTVRFAACTADEDRADGMKLDLDLFRAYTEGYLSEIGDELSAAELDSLADGAAVITLELASRFLADYLTGDRYFRIESPDQNLRRARAQLALFRDMMAHMGDMKRIIRDTAAEKM
ncbi:MAG: aminoglycoside phosphotransferase family protein [Lachnospiraceae bacterium]|nr:aminoglycoside phosphotransferase family protein [Lachnospiraceae bacterium]